MSELPPKRSPRKSATSSDASRKTTEAKPRSRKTASADSADGSRPPRTPRAARSPRPASATSRPRRRNQPPPTRWWPKLLLLLSMLLALASGWVYWVLYAPLSLPANGYRLKVERGSGYHDALQRLQDDGLLRQMWLSRWYFRQQHPRPLQAGAYEFKPGLNVAALLRQLAAGEGLIVNRITVIEGTTFAQLRARLDADPQVQHTLQGKDAATILASLGASETHPEGLFAPDTYVFAPDESDLVILKRLYQQQQRLLQQAWDSRAPNLPYRTPYEALIMASLVEKETGNASERPQIAGVFVRRLQQGMRLQTDPTVIYGMGASYAGNIRKADLLAYTPYNTYRIDGLPPTPIALPGKSAIFAALHPAEGNALYFVARGDGSGTHVFSADLAAHNQAVAAYLQAERARRASATTAAP